MRPRHNDPMRPRHNAPRSLICILAIVAFALSASAASARPLFGYADTVFGGDGYAALSKQAGADSDRVFVRWDAIELRPGAYNWWLVDGQYRTLLAHGLRPLWVVVGAPAWDRIPNCPDINACPPKPSADRAWGRFFAALAARYPQSVGVEVWNEPNIPKWWASGPNPARYTKLLRTAYTAIKRVAPTMPVISAGLVAGRPSPGIHDDAFLRDMYRAGARGHMDGIGVHLYPGFNVVPLATELRNELADVRGVRAQAHDRTPLWITETGDSTGVGYFSEAQQADRLAVTYRSLAVAPDIQAIYVFRLIESGGAPGSWDYGMGVYHPDLTAKPAVAALLAALNAPPWPWYPLQAVVGSRHPLSSVPFAVTATGYGGPGPVVYRWVVWHRDHWSWPLRVSAAPTTSLRLSQPGRYRLAVQLVTPLDTYQSNVRTVVVAAPPAPHGHH